MKSSGEQTACERAMARYREALGSRWNTADELLFRGAWNEGAAERDRQLRAELADANDELARLRPRAEYDRNLRSDLDGVGKSLAWTRDDLRDAKALLERCQRELAALSCPLRELFDDIDAMINRKEPGAV